MDAEPVIVTTTSDQRETLEKIARELIANRLAACVQIGAPVESFYRWEGKVQVATEFPCVIKTVQKNWPEIQRIINKLHHYDLPQLVLVRVSDGSAAYLQWIVEQSTG